MGLGWRPRSFSCRHKDLDENGGAQGGWVLSYQHLPWVCFSQISLALPPSLDLSKSQWQSCMVVRNLSELAHRETVGEGN